MGRDLTLLVVTAWNMDHGFAHTLLDCWRRSELWDEIDAVEKRVGRNVPVHFTTYLARLPGKVDKTPYGKPLLMVPASELFDLATNKGVTDNPTNRAVWAYLAAVPGDTWIALWWH